MSLPPDIEEKLKKLLRVDDKRGASKLEMEQAMAAAQRLALKHGVDLATIDATELDTAGEPIVHETFNPKDEWGDDYQMFPAPHRFVSQILGRFFAVEVIEVSKALEIKKGSGDYAYSEWKTKKTMQFIGRKTNVHLAIYIYGFLNREFTDQWREYKIKVKAPMTDRSAFFVGIYNGLVEKLKLEKGEVEKEVQPQLARAGTTMALVLVKEAEKIKAAVAEAHPRLQYYKRDPVEVSDWSAVHAGERIGKKININPALNP